jgi:protein-S-isoprenylcysteine O-methyltransferase Ste14
LKDPGTRKEPPATTGRLRREGAKTDAKEMRGGPLALRGSSLALAGLLLSLLFIALAALGWGGWRGFLLDPLRRSAAISLAALAAVTPLCGCNIALGVETDRANDWVLIALLIGGLSLGWASGYCDHHSIWALGREGVRALGLTLFLIGAALRIGSILSLADQFTVWVSIQQDHELVTDKLYRYLRHPSYTGAIFTLLGWALVCRSAVGILIALLMSALLVSRLNAEEKLLLQAFPRDYADYIRRTWRLLPFVY